MGRANRMYKGHQEDATREAGDKPGGSAAKQESTSRSDLWFKEDKIFPGSPVTGNLPAHAGDTGSTPGLGRFYMMGSNEARALQLLTLCRGTRALQQEKPSHHD